MGLADDLGIPDLPDRYIFGAMCQECHLAAIEPHNSALAALAALALQHASPEDLIAGKPLGQHDCRASWELVKIKPTPPIGEWRSRPFASWLSRRSDGQ